MIRHSRFTVYGVNDVLVARAAALPDKLFDYFKEIADN
jgi:hypothetical protein